jgi:hypothetical protein
MGRETMLVLPKSGMILIAALGVTPCAFAGVPATIAGGNLVDVPVANCTTDANVRFADTAPDKHDRIRAPASVATKLAYYRSEFLSILAPRGWHCVTYWNSSGISLAVTPQTSSSPNETDSPFVQIYYAMGDSNFSQHDVIARVAARFFPSHRAYVKSVIAENHENSGDTSYDIPFGPAPAMRITYRSASLVEYVLAAGPAGDDDWLFAGGTMSKSSFPVYGAAFLAPDDSYAEVVIVRLPNELKVLAPSIIASAGLRP